MNCPKCGTKMIKEAEYEWYNYHTEQFLDKIYHCDCCGADFREVLDAKTQESLRIEPLYFG